MIWQSRICAINVTTHLMLRVVVALLRKKIDKSEQFLFNIIKTLIRRIDQGVIKIEGTRDE